MSDDKEKKDLTEQVEDSKISFEDLAKISRKSSAFDRVTTIILLVILILLLHTKNLTTMKWHWNNIKLYLSNYQIFIQLDLIMQTSWLT